MNQLHNPTDFGKVGVLMGGQFAERDISLMSGKAVLDAFKAYGINVHGIDVGDDIVEVLLKAKFDRIFVAMHGTWGEDGILQGLLEAMKIPYTGSGVAASALAMNKIHSKLVLEDLGINVPKSVNYEDGLSYETVVERLGSVICVKPCSQGSSVGITQVNSAKEFQTAINKSLEFDSEVVIEPWIEGTEVTVGILDQQALPVIKIATPVGFYDYEAKYFSEETQYLIPCGLSIEKQKEIQAISLKAYQSLGCRHWGRVDGILDHSGKYWVFEVNTIPGLTSHSLVPKAAAAMGLNFQEVVVRILGLTMNEHHNV